MTCPRQAEAIQLYGLATPARRLAISLSIYAGPLAHLVEQGTFNPFRDRELDNPRRPEPPLPGETQVQGGSRRQDPAGDVGRKVGQLPTGGYSSAPRSREVTMGLTDTPTPTRTLGVHFTSEAQFWTVVEDGKVLAGQPERVLIPNGLRYPADLEALRDETRRRMTQVGPTQVAILLAENSYRAGHASWVARIGGETIARLVAMDLGIRARLVTRRTVRSVLGLPTRGGLAGHADEVITDPSGAHWALGRDVAALVALTAERLG